MTARQLIDGAAYGPEMVKAMGEAFDLAWAEIAKHYTAPPEIQAARMRLAEAMLTIGEKGSVDVQVLKTGALQAMAGKLLGPAGI